MWRGIAVSVALLILMACCQCSAEEAPIGVGEIAQATRAVTIPGVEEESLFQFPAGHAVDADSVALWSEAREWKRSEDRSPEGGTYSVLYGRALRFSPEDAGREVTVKYQYRPVRLALPEPVDLSNLDYQGAYLEEVLTERLAERGFEIIPPAEVRLAATGMRLSFGPAIEGDGTSLPVEKIAELAQMLDAGYVLVSGIGNVQSDAESVVKRVVCSRVSVRLYDGESGDLIFSRSRSASETQLKGIGGLFQSSEKARKSLIRVSVAELLADYFGDRG